MFQLRYGLFLGVLVLVSLLSVICLGQKIDSIAAKGVSESLSVDRGNISLWLPLVTNRAQFPQVTHGITFTQIATSSALPRVLFASTSNSLTPIYSLDGGYNWQTISTASWGVVDNVNVAIAPKIDQGVRLLVGTKRGNRDYRDAPGLFRSGDYGATWAKVDMPMLSSPYGQGHQWQVVASPKSPRRLYLSRVYPYEVDRFYGTGPSSKLYTSTDAGLTWTDITPPMGYGWLAVFDTVLPSNVLEDQVYVGYSPYGAHDFWRSDDGGHTWSGIDNLPMGTYPLLQLDGYDSNKLYAFNSRGGFTSINGGTTWISWAHQPCSEVNFQQLWASPSVGNFLLTLCSDGVYRSYDGGDNWEHLSSRSGQLFAADYGSPGRILWAREDGLWASENRGSSWEQLTVNMNP